MSILLGYRRKSMVRNQADLISPERQARACDLWIEMQGSQYTIEWYEDVDGHRSGREEKGRPGWQNLMAQLDRPEVAGVIADSFDRCYRNVHQFLNFLNRLEHLNKRLITVKEGLDTTSTLGRAIVTILMVIYQLESDQTSDRMTANVKYKREVLGRHWGPTPFGCDRNDQGHLIPTAKTYYLNPLTGEARPGPVILSSAERVSKDGGNEGLEPRRYHDALLQLYQLYATGQHSYDTVALMLNAAGWRYYANAKGSIPRPFTRDDVRRATSFWQLFKGELPLGNITNTTGPVLTGGHAPILPPALCDEVGQIRQTRNRQFARRRGKQPAHFYLLTGLIHCAACGKPLMGNFQKGRRIYRHYGAKKECKEKWLNADDIETLILAQIAELAHPELLAQIAAEAERLAREAFSRDDTARTLLSELDRQKQRLTRLEDLYLDAEIDKPRYHTRKTELTGQIANLEDRLYKSSQLTNFSHILSRITSTLQHIPTAPPETKKTLLLSVFERLDTSGGQIIHLTPRPWAKPFF